MNDLLVKLRKAYPDRYAEIKKPTNLPKPRTRDKSAARVKIISFTLVPLWRSSPISVLTVRLS